MVIWMANWIRLPARQSSSTYEAAVIANRHTRRSVRWCARLAAPHPITRLHQNCVSEFKPPCEKRSPNRPRARLCEILRCCSEEGSQNRGPFFLELHGIGWLSPRPSFLQPLSPGTYCPDCSDQAMTSFSRRSLSP